jgi:hypothetical protein
VTLGYEFAPIDVSIMTHPKAFAAGVEAMGLWLWGMAYAKQHRTEGRLHRAAVLGAWGGRRNVMHAKRLVEAGLWTERDDGDWDIHNFEKKSAGSSSSAERMRRLREKRRQSDPAPSPEQADGVTASDVTSDAGDVTVTRHERHQCSPSPSYSSSGESAERGPPAWFLGAVATAEMSEGTIDRVPSRWNAYLASRKRKGWAMNHEDAVGWLSEVIGRERRERANGERGSGVIAKPEGGASARARKELT